MSTPASALPNCVEMFGKLEGLNAALARLNRGYDADLVIKAAPGIADSYFALSRAEAMSLLQSRIDDLREKLKALGVDPDL